MPFRRDHISTNIPRLTALLKITCPPPKTEGRARPHRVSGPLVYCADFLPSRFKQSLWDCVIKAGIEIGGVGVGELDEAVSVSDDVTKVLPGLEVGAGLDIEIFAG